MKIHDDVLVLPSIVKMPPMNLPVSSTALRTSRGVVLISPGSNTRKQADEITRFGRVTDIVAPNLLHHRSVHLAQDVFSQATLWGVPGFREKRSDLVWDKLVTQAEWTYADEIQLIEIGGVPSLHECVFFHKSSKTLVVADLFFNLLHAKGLGSWIILKIFGTYRRFGISSFYLRAVTDQEAFKKSLRDILALDVQNIVMGHGDPVTHGARDLIHRAIKERDLL